MTDVTVTTEAPPTNTPEARTPEGTLKDQSPATTTPSQETKSTQTPEGGSTFLTQKPAEKATEAGPKTNETEPKPDAPQGAPDKYTDFKLPDGYEFDKAALTDFQTLAKSSNLTQAQAQSLVDLWSKHSLETARAPYDLWANTQDQWHKDILSRFGGEEGAARLSANINKVIDTALPPTLQRSFRAALDFTGAGSNPDILEAFSIMLKPLMEGKPVPGGGPTKEGQTQPNSQPSGPVDIAAAMYPHLVKNRPQ